jgi:CxxC motif-containing protein (DUF1111 family)
MCNALRFVRASMLAGIAGGAVISLSGPVLAQVSDPGVRPLTATQTNLNGSTPKGALSLSQVSPAVTAMDGNTVNFFRIAGQRFQEVDSVSGTIGGTFPEDGTGLGPRFNSNSCASCHIFPIVGGTSPPGNFSTHDNSGRPFTGNPQISVATLDGAKNTVPSFITANGPVREARFILNPDGSLDGGVHDLFVITGRSDASGCTIAQPNFAQQLANTNVIFRIPTPTFGLGLVENTPDGDQDNTIGLVGAFNGQATAKSNLGISGSFNRSGNDGTITRFGWKAQNKSLLIFAGEAYNVEQGVTNEVFPNERDDSAGCRFNALPEDHTNVANSNNSGVLASDFSSDTVNFAAFMRLSGPAQPVTPFNASQSRGQTVFFNIGCGACHIQSQTTLPSSIFNIDGNGKPVNPTPITYQPFSDFALHDMGLGLADGIFQGNAEGDEFRTAPLWGVGQRVFFLHDGRAGDLLTAIFDHDLPAPNPATNASKVADPDGSSTQPSEAHQVIQNFNALSITDKQNLLNFLRAL